MANSVDCCSDQYAQILHCCLSPSCQRESSKFQLDIIHKLLTCTMMTTLAFTEKFAAGKIWFLRNDLNKCLHLHSVGQLYKSQHNWTLSGLDTNLILLKNY